MHMRRHPLFSLFLLSILLMTLNVATVEASPGAHMVKLLEAMREKRERPEQQQQQQQQQSADADSRSSLRGAHQHARHWMHRMLRDDTTTANAADPYWAPPTDSLYWQTRAKLAEQSRRAAESARHHARHAQRHAHSVQRQIERCVDRTHLYVKLQARKHEPAAAERVDQLAKWCRQQVDRVSAAKDGKRRDE